MDEEHLTPVGLLNIKMICSFPEDWMVWRKFRRENGDEIFVKGFGRNKEEAMLDYDYELEQESINCLFINCKLIK